jgi:hypothetical protein
VTEAGSLRDAVAALYSSDPGEFTGRRALLVAQAREDGDKALAKTIAALRKPTRSAWVVNMLVRADRFAVSRMTALGDELRDAERVLDGARIRELSRRRRELMAALLQQAFSAVGQESPPAALRDEVTSTLTAALADPAVAEQLRAGTLVRAVHRDGFAILEAEDPGSWADASAASGPASSKRAGKAPAGPRPARRPARQVTAPEPSRPGPSRAKPGGRAAEPGAPGTVTRKDSRQEAAARDRADRQRVSRDRAEREKAEREKAREDRARQELARQEQADRARAERELRKAALAEARQTAAKAGRTATAAAREEDEAAASVRALTEQLAQARQRHAEARVTARHAQAAQRRAQDQLERLRD